MNPLMSDKGKLASMIVGGGVEKFPKEDEESMKEVSLSMEQSVAADEVMAAMEAKDKDAFGKALKSFIYLCEEGEDEMEDKEEEMPEADVEFKS